MGVSLSYALIATMNFILFSLTLLSTSMLANGECVYQEDPENVVSTQLEGSWGYNQEISMVLTLWSDNLDIKEVKFYKNETVLDILPSWACDYIDRIYLVGELTIVRLDDTTEVLPFVLTNISGNPHIVYYYIEYDDAESMIVMWRELRIEWRICFSWVVTSTIKDLQLGRGLIKLSNFVTF